MALYESQQVKIFKLAQEAKELGVRSGAYQAATLVLVTEKLLDKPGGLVSNDVFFPGVWLDDMPHWELGVLMQLRQLLNAFNNNTARPATNDVLDQAAEFLSVPRTKWQFPSAQNEYRKGLDIFREEFININDRGGTSKLKANQSVEYIDTFKLWLQDVDNTLAQLSNRLLASVSDRSVVAQKMTRQGIMVTEQKMIDKTPWLEIDDIFYQSRGYTWALLHFLQAVELDHPALLKNPKIKNALKLAIDELSMAQEPLWSPMVLNGKGMGILANHSLVMASYIANVQNVLMILRQELVRPL